MMRKELVAAVAAALVLGVGTAVLMPVGAFAAEKEKKEASACDTINDKKKAECVKTEAIAKYKSEALACDKIKDKKKKAKCLKAVADGKKKVGKK